MKLDIRHFEPWEFRGWWDKVSPRLLVVIDVFRSHWGRAVTVSPAGGAIGRRKGASSRSQHNYDRWGEVRAVDLMPYRMSSSDAMKHAVALAKQAGATGIGLYPHWSPRPGIHIDVRTDREIGDPALWSALDVGKSTPDQRIRGSIVGSQVYLALSAAYVAVDDR